VKLIRDRTPDLERGSTRIARDDEEFEMLLRMKLMEEAAEAASSTSREELIKELGDLQSIYWELIELLGINDNEVIEAQLEKAARKGGFDDRIVLLHDPLSNKTNATI
jgi:predicted house-cleaning noncanonical NTP pyrophosphatase (MazG superfamily)